MSTEKNPNRVAAGLRTTLGRDDVSEETKAHALERLEQMDGQTTATPRHVVAPESEQHAREILEAAGYTVTPNEPEDEHQVRVLAGYKAALKNPRVSEEAKKHAQEYLKEHNAL
ncbi:Conidiation protein 6-domain-containing protein [Mycena polygramma]|nr:Conidiation protein 6-domain-containing protein [Mycena polygramma]